MPEYRVEFPDEVWKIVVKGSGKAAEEAAYKRAAAARAANGDEAIAPFEECRVRKVTAKLRAELKGYAYLSPAALLERCRSIGDTYQRQGLALTVRGMYYQLVSKKLLPSGQREYNRVKSTLAKARLKGDFPLDLLSDSSRRFHPGRSRRYDMDAVAGNLQASQWLPRLGEFFLEIDRWYRQEDLPLVLFEKEALSNVFGPTCDRLGVPWMAVKGYPSVSTLFELHEVMVASVDDQVQGFGDGLASAFDLDQLDPTKAPELERLIEGHKDAVSRVEEHIETVGRWVDRFVEDGESHKAPSHREHRYRYGTLHATEVHQGSATRIRILYFGDHDPDGMEIPHDLERRLRIIQVRRDEVVPFTIERCGLNRDQIERYDPPPFWAKTSSSRHPAYEQNHPWARARAWELDALDPPVLRALVTEHVDAYFDDTVHEENQAALETAREAFDELLYTTTLPAVIDGRNA